MMRVHLRGVVIGVGTVLTIVLIVSVFNALDMPSDDDESVSRHALSTDNEETDAADNQPPPRPGARQRPAGGPRAGGPGAHAGGPGARAGGPGARAGGPGARAGGPGARAGGPGARAGGPGARAGGLGARAGGPRAGGPRAGGPGARVGGARFGGEGGMSQLGGPAARGPGARAGGPRGRMGGAMAARGGAAALGQDGEDMDMEDPEAPMQPRPRPGGAAARRAGGRMGPPGARARAPPVDDDESEAGETSSLTPAAARRKAAREAKKKKASEEKKEEVTEPPKKKEPPYPEWWKLSYPKSAVSSQEGQFVGDQPLFPTCPHFEATSANSKAKRYGPVEPPNYMRNSKNPCWFEWSGKKDIIKCLPYFYIAGVSKSATADLYNRVRSHPNVRAGGASTYYWWDRQRYGASRTLKYTRETKRTGDSVSLKEYSKTVVGDSGKNLTKELLYKGMSSSIFGDATPTYLTENTQWDVFEGNEGCSEPRVIPATFIRHAFPQARIVLILRDPVERLYSRFLANVPYVQEFENATASLFHTFTVQAIQGYRECFARTSIRHCAYNASLFSNAVIRLSEGMYPVFLEDWLRIFPKEQILILKYEDYVADVRGHLIKVFEHLGLDPLDAYSLLKVTDMAPVRKGRTREEEGYMLAETVTLLEDFYTPFNLKLADMLDDEKWLFKRPEMLQPAVHLDAHLEEPAEDIAPAQQADEPQDTEDNTKDGSETGEGEGSDAGKEEGSDTGSQAKLRTKNEASDI